jgi:phospholipase C
MSGMPLQRRHLSHALAGASFFALTVFGSSASVGADVDQTADRRPTATPIKHVIVLIGENRSFDHLFATYRPASGDSVKNLLSEGIVNADGTPGPNFALARQFRQQPINGAFETSFFISLPPGRKSPYQTLPVPGLNFAPTAPDDPSQFATNGVFGPLTSTTPASQLAQLEPSLDADDLKLLTTGAALGLPSNFNFLAQDVDTRIKNFNHLANGPYPLTGTGNPNSLPFDSYTGDTTHRLFEMWQQSDCSLTTATRTNPSGCLNDLYPYVITSYTGPADNGGSNSMAFYNMQLGDAPIWKRLADQYTTSDNFHQAAMGGTGMNHVYLGSGDDVFWSDGHGNAATPPSHIANPNPMPGTDNQYIVDANFDGNFADCADRTRAGIAPVLDYLGSLSYHPASKCDAFHFYMVNNDSPGFLPNGQVDTKGIAGGGSIPPSNVRTIGEALNDQHISWAYYGGAYNAAVALANDPNPSDPNPLVQVGQTYCNICNFESYTNAIMGDPAQRTAHIKDTTDFFAAVDGDKLPAVSFVKPDGFLDGHPASSKVDLFEAMIENILGHLKAKPELMAETALMITVDEGGGYYDSGYIQPLDFFGDGPRIPLIIVSNFTRGGHVNHSYTDHVSILKFIERNWGLQPLTGRSRDNLPNPHSTHDNPYVPVNSPAIGDLFDMFDFDHRDDDHH